MCIAVKPQDLLGVKPPYPPAFAYRLADRLYFGHGYARSPPRSVFTLHSLHDIPPHQSLAAWPRYPTRPPPSLPLPLPLAHKYNVKRACTVFGLSNTFALLSRNWSLPWNFTWQINVADWDFVSFYNLVITTQNLKPLHRYHMCLVKSHGRDQFTDRPIDIAKWKDIFVQVTLYVWFIYTIN